MTEKTNSIVKNKKKEINNAVMALTEKQIQLVKNTVARGATDDELQLFLYTAQRTGLDPLTKQIHFVKRGGQMTIQTGIDGYRAIAERSGTLAGIDDVIYTQENGNQPQKATVTVYRFLNGERVPFTATARWSEYAPAGNQGFMWKKMPFLMLGKCAEALALRKAFPNDLTGLYTDEEMTQADKPTAKIIKTATVISPVGPTKEQNIKFNQQLFQFGILKKDWNEKMKKDWDKLTQDQAQKYIDAQQKKLDSQKQAQTNTPEQTQTQKTDVIDGVVELMTQNDPKAQWVEENTEV